MIILALYIAFIAILANFIGKRAADKNLNRLPYWILTPVAWFGGQFIFSLVTAIIYQIVSGKNPDSTTVTILAYTGSIICYLLLYKYVDTRPMKSDISSKIHELGKDDQGA